MKYDYVVFEGNIGAGKTTVVNRLAPMLNARPLFEQFSDNPFLPLFYQNPERYAFSLEMSFLADRFHQLSSIHLGDLFQPQILADYSLYKSWIFARQNLKGQELSLYQNLFDIISGRLPKPDIIVYLNRSLSGIRRNIVTRARSYEQEIPDSYLLNLRDSYIQFFRQLNDIPVVIIDIDSYDFLYKDDDLEILKEILDKDYPVGINFHK